MSSKKVLLVFAGVQSRFFPELPIALIYLAWALEKKGFPVEIFDMRLDSMQKITRADYLFVGISSMTGISLREGLKLAQHIRTLNPACPLVWGGVHVSLLPEQSLSHPLVDIVVRGEGEMTVQELATALEQGRDLAGIPGLSFKQQGRPVHNPNREFMDLDTIDLELPYHLVEIQRYSLDAIPVHTSRGCPFRCGFCYNLAFNQRTWRKKSAQRVVDEIDYLVKKFGNRKISFGLEDEFFIDVQRVKEICRGLVDRNLQVRWYSFCRFNSFQKVDEELLALLEKSGCAQLAFGAESGSERIREEVIHKDIKLDWILAATERLSKTRVEEVVSFMSGLPTETEADLEATFGLIDRLARLNPSIYLNGVVLYTPFPGTPLYEKVTRDYGYRSPESLEAWADFGIFRNVGVTWHPPRYIKKLKVISLLTRFPFWKKKFSLGDVGRVIGGSRFARFPLNWVYWFYAKDAAFRWKHRLFGFAGEWLLLEKVLERVRGFV